MVCFALLICNVDAVDIFPEFENFVFHGGSLLRQVLHDNFTVLHMFVYLSSKGEIAQITDGVNDTP